METLRLLIKQAKVKIAETELFVPSYSQTFVPDEPVFTSKISPDGQLVAVSYCCGKVYIVNTLTREIVQKSELESDHHKIDSEALLITSFSWAPGDNANHGGWRLYGAATDGSVREWTALLGNKALKHDKNVDNQYQSIGISRDGFNMCLAGVLPVIEIWDLNNEQEPVKMLNFEDNECHSQRINTVKFYPDSDFNFYSGGWDKTVKFWSTKQKQPINQIHGVQICGDTVDMDADCKTVVLGGGKGGEGIQIWDLRKTTGPIQKIPWRYSESKVPLSRPMTSVKFMNELKMIAATCTEDDESSAKIFDIQTGQEIYAFKDLYKSSYTIDISEVAKIVSIGDVAGKFQLLNYENVRLQNRQENVQLAYEEDNKVSKAAVTMTNLKRKLAVRNIFQNMLTQKKTQHLSVGTQENSADQTGEESEEQTQPIGQNQTSNKAEITNLEENVENEDKPTSVKDELEDIPLYQQILSQKTKAKASQDLLGMLTYNQFISHQSGKAIVSGFSHKSGAYDVEHDAFPKGMADFKKQSKQRFLQEVSLREQMLKEELQVEEDYIQQSTQKESFRLVKLNKSVHDTQSPPLVKTIDEHLQSSQLGSQHFAGNPFNSMSNKVVGSDQKQKNAAGRIQNIKLYVQTELLADGIIQRVVPFSTRAQSKPNEEMYSQSKKSLLNSPSKASSIFQANQSSASATADYYTMLYQKNLVVQHPLPDDQVAKNFQRHWKAESMGVRKQSFEPKSILTQRLMHSNNVSQTVSYASLAPTMVTAKSRKNSEFQQFEVLKVPDEARKRIPDSEHLTRMRAHLVQAHHNSAFVKELGEDDGYVPTLVQQKLLAKRLSVQEEFGDSLEVLLKKNKESIQREQNLRDLLEMGIQGGQVNSDDESSCSETEQIGSGLKIISNQSDRNIRQQSFKLSHAAEQFDESLKRMDLIAGLELAIKSEEDIIQESMQMQYRGLDFKDQVMKDNEFFKKYSAQYSKNVQQILDNNFGKKLNEHIKLKPDADTFNNKILAHMGEQSLYRKKMPQLFTGKGYDNTAELMDKMKSNFRPVPLPLEVVHRKEAQENMMVLSAKKSPQQSPSKKADDPLNDPKYIRRLKMANYGRWFIAPQQYQDKVVWLNKELKSKNN